MGLKIQNKKKGDCEMSRKVIKSASLGSNARKNLNENFAELYSNLGIVGVTASAAELNILDNCTATTAEVNGACDLSGQVTAAAAGFSGAGTIVKSAIRATGDMKKTEIMVDLTDAKSTATNLDIIGVSGASYIGRITAALNGTILFGKVTCMEVPIGGAVNIDLYSANENTGAYDGLVTALTANTALVTAGGNWTLGLEKVMTGIPAANQYLYLTSGTTTAGTYTAGKLLIEFWGY